MIDRERMVALAEARKAYDSGYNKSYNAGAYARKDTDDLSMSYVTKARVKLATKYLGSVSDHVEAMRSHLRAVAKGKEIANMDKGFGAIDRDLEQAAAHIYFLMGLLGK